MPQVSLSFSLSRESVAVIENQLGSPDVCVREKETK